MTPARSDTHSGAAAELFSKAERCRRLAAGVNDRQAADVLRAMAENYEEGARLKRC